MSEELNELDALQGAAAAADAMSSPEVATDGQGSPAAEVVADGVTPQLIAAAMPEAVMMADAAAAFIGERYQVELTQETRSKAAEKLAPLLVKYDFDSPFLRKWRYEIDALVFIGATGYGIYKAVKESKEVSKTDDGGE